MIRFSRDKVKLLYKLMVEETGGSFGIRDEELLDSALEGIFQTFDGKELYQPKKRKEHGLAIRSYQTTHS